MYNSIRDALNLQLELEVESAGAHSSVENYVDIMQGMK
jgi:hypothetical protein